MLFNFKLLFRLLYRALFDASGTHARLTPKRCCVLLILSFLYCMVEITCWVGLLLDPIFFPGSRRQAVRQPVFIIGPPRSGTTFLQRLLAKDEGRFSSMKAWEIFFAPSITQKKLYAALGRVESLFGSPLSRLVLKLEQRIFKSFSVLHPSSFFNAEEDGPILLHIFSSATAFVALPFAEELWPYFLFDQELAAAQKARIMGFYKRCVQNHLYVFGPDKVFFSKNPMFSTMVQSLGETFPDAKFVYMARTPLETVPSTVSLISYCFNTVMSPLEPHPYLDVQLEMLSRYYTYPLMKFEALPDSRHQIISYTTLVEKPEETVRELYTRFGITLSPAYGQALQKEQEKARRYKSTHTYSLEQCGLTPEAIVKRYEPIFDRFGFDRQPYPPA